jgi:hypothetical protein
MRRDWANHFASDDNVVTIGESGKLKTASAELLKRATERGVRAARRR